MRSNLVYLAIYMLMYIQQPPKEPVSTDIFPSPKGRLKKARNNTWEPFGLRIVCRKIQAKQKVAAAGCLGQKGWGSSSALLHILGQNPPSLLSQGGILASQEPAHEAAEAGG